MLKPLLTSFYTPGGYYEECAGRFAERAEKLGLDYHLERMEIPPGKTWPDVCRMKIPFLRNLRRRHPGRMIIWMDVDCAIKSLPAFIEGSTADIIGFQRGFDSPVNIGYATRTRFWEPCFLGFGGSPAVDRYFERAAELERTLTINATDDYFFEEAWRAEARHLTFQLIPSEYGKPGAHEFFVFGSSSNVDSFRGKVVQHSSPVGTTRRSFRQAVIGTLPGPVLRAVRSVRAQGRTVRGLLSANAAVIPPNDFASLAKRAGLNGDARALADLDGKLDRVSGGRESASATLDWGRAFADYRDGTGEPVNLMWWDTPAPGNFGDWLSPYIVSKTTGRPLRYTAPGLTHRASHVIGLGSIAKFALDNSIVLGAGISQADTPLKPSADYRFVRGPRTADAIRRSGGKAPELFGDPGILMRRLFPLERKGQTGRVALVRHLAHRNLELALPDGVEEISILAARGAAIEHFLRSLMDKAYVITSAMHCYIVCQSYGVPCALVTFAGGEDAVHGDGTKYLDYSEGVGLPARRPAVLPTDLRSVSLELYVTDDRVPDAALDGIEAEMRRSLAGEGR